MCLTKGQKTNTIKSNVDDRLWRISAWRSSTKTFILTNVSQFLLSVYSFPKFHTVLHEITADNLNLSSRWELRCLQRNTRINVLQVDLSDMSRDAV